MPRLGSIPFGNAYLAYSYPDYVALGGSVRIPAPGMAFNAGISGELLVGKSLFSFHGFGELCLAGLACLLRAEGWVTSTGIVACASIAGELHPGAGYRWGAAWPEIWLVDGCKPSHYWVNVRANALSLAPFAAAAATSFTVARGERAKNVRLDGVGGAPRIEVRGPGRRGRLDRGADFASGRTIRVLRQEAGKVTWIGVENGPPGTYVVTTLPGSAALAQIAATRPPTNTYASRSRHGVDASAPLRHRARPGTPRDVLRAGRTSYKRLGAVAGGKGALRFAPAQGRVGCARSSPASSSTASPPRSAPWRATGSPRLPDSRGPASSASAGAPRA